MQQLKLNDAFQFAINLEKSGREFYLKCSENARQEDVQALFTFLAEQEEKHLKTFQRMRSRLDQDEKTTLRGDPAAGLLEAYAEAFFPGEALIGEKPLKKLTPAEAAGFGVKIEQNSIEYYKRLQAVIPETDRQSVDLILEQEEQHRQKFMQLKDSLQRAGG